MTCFECNDPSCDNGGTELECTAKNVLDTHEFLTGLNPLLESVAPADVDYACFQLNASILVDTGMYLPIVDYGCTFRQTKFCNSWDDDVAVHQCNVCHTDGCNAISGNSPNPPGVTTTTTANPVGTGGVDSKVRTGTKLVIGGLCLMLLFF